jgi:hypothetical protein
LFDISLDATYDYEQQFGRNLNSELQTAVVRHLQNEMAYYVFDKMYEQATGNQGTTYTFDLTPSAGITANDHLQSLWRMLSKMSGKIYNNLGRGRGNIIVTGDRLIEELNALPETVWKPEPNTDSVRGPYKAGTLLKKYKVFHNPAMPENEFFMTFKGVDWWEAPYYVGIYLPMMSSKFMMFPDFHGEQGYISMEAHKYLFKLHVVKGSLTETQSS